MDAVKQFNDDLSQLCECKPPISKAKMTSLTKSAIKAIKFYKHVVQSVEKFVQKCRPEFKVPGLYVIDSIVRQSRHQFGADKDLFVPRFARNINLTFQYLFQCPAEDKSKIVRVLNLWQKNQVFASDVVQPLMDMANPSYQPTPLSKLPPLVSASPIDQTSPMDDDSNGGLMTVPDQSTQLQPNNGSNPHMLTSLDSNFISQLHTISSILSGGKPNEIQLLGSQTLQQQQSNPYLYQQGGQQNQEPIFNRQLLDYDYGDDDDVTGTGGNDNAASAQQRSNQMMSSANDPAMLAVSMATNLLSNPNLFKQLQQSLATTADHASTSNQMGQHMLDPNFAAAFRSGYQDPQGSMQPDTTSPEQQDDIICLGDQDDRVLPPIQDSFSRSDSFSRQQSGSSSRRSPKRSRRSPRRVSRSRSRSRSKSRRHRSRSRSRRRHSRSADRDRDRDREKEQLLQREKEKEQREKDRKGREIERKAREKEREARRKEKEKEDDRRKRGLPAMRKGHMTVCTTTLWLGHVSKLVAQEDIADAFGEHGEILTIDLIPPRGCAFVSMNRRQDATKCLAKLDKAALHGKAITMAWAPGKGVKGKQYKDYWDVKTGASYIPWDKLTMDIDLEALEDGGMVDEETMPPWLTAREKARKDGTDLDLRSIPGMEAYGMAQPEISGLTQTTALVPVAESIVTPSFGAMAMDGSMAIGQQQLQMGMNPFGLPGSEYMSLPMLTMGNPGMMMGMPPMPMVSVMGGAPMDTSFPPPIDSFVTFPNPGSMFTNFSVPPPSLGLMPPTSFAESMCIAAPTIVTSSTDVGVSNAPPNLDRGIVSSLGLPPSTLSEMSTSEKFKVSGEADSKGGSRSTNRDGVDSAKERFKSKWENVKAEPVDDKETNRIPVFSSLRSDDEFATEGKGKDYESTSNPDWGDGGGRGDWSNSQVKEIVTTTTPNLEKNSNIKDTEGPLKERGLGTTSLLGDMFMKPLCAGPMPHPAASGRPFNSGPSPIGQPGAGGLGSTRCPRPAFELGNPPRDTVRPPFRPGPGGDSIPSLLGRAPFQPMGENRGLPRGADGAPPPRGLPINEGNLRGPIPIRGDGPKRGAFIDGPIRGPNMMGGGDGPGVFGPMAGPGPGPRSFGDPHGGPPFNRFGPNGPGFRQRFDGPPRDGNFGPRGLRPDIGGDFGGPRGFRPPMRGGNRPMFNEGPCDDFGPAVGFGPRPQIRGVFPGRGNMRGQPPPPSRGRGPSGGRGN